MKLVHFIQLMEEFSLLLIKYILNFLISKSFFAVNNRFKYIILYNIALLINFHKAGKNKAVHFFPELAHIIGKLLRQHWHYIIHKINTCASCISFFIKC